MKAVTFHEHGGVERLRYEEVPRPSLGPHEVLIRVKACALNHLDIWIRQGIPAYRINLPHISGSDVSGVIEEVGEACEDGLVPGQAVFVAPGLSCWRCEACLAGQETYCDKYRILGAQIDGGYAEFVKVPAINVLPLPAGLTFEQAAAFPLVSLTAWHMVMTLAQVKPGESVLVLGAGSGVGSMAIQIANLVGARVFTTVGDQEKAAKAQMLGAIAVLNHSHDDLIHGLKEFTNGRGVDVVIEHIGQAVWSQCIRALAKGGRLVTCGATTGSDLTLDARYLFSRQLKIMGSYMGTRSELLAVTRLIGAGKLRPVIDAVFPLSRAREAQERLLSRKVFGKVLVIPPD
ncbi:MAG: alcohol dehydrogenase [Nitrospirae bacterium]|nr:MAG: alcohol dehydrogenase [Nitrospirota bacterium]